MVRPPDNRPPDNRPPDNGRQPGDDRDDPAARVHRPGPAIRVPKLMPVVRLGDMPDPGPAPWLIDRLWLDGAFGVVGALPKSWKSYFTIQFAIAVATGRPFLDRFKVRRTGRVLLFYAEGGRRSARRRLGAICRGLEIPPSEPEVYAIDLPVLRLDQRPQMDAFVATVANMRPVLVIIDPLREVHGGDENDSAWVTTLLGPLRELQEKTGVSVMLVHHNTKPNGDARRRPLEQLRGHGALGAAVDSSIGLAASGQGSQKRVTVSAIHRDGAEPDPFQIQLTVKLPLLDAQGGEAIYVEVDDDPESKGAGKADQSKLVAEIAERTRLRERIHSAIGKAQEKGIPFTSSQRIAKAIGSRVIEIRELLQTGVETGTILHNGRGHPYLLPPVQQGGPEP